MAGGDAVVRRSTTAGKPSGQPVDVLTGFVDDHGDDMGRAVGMTIDKRGALLVADDVGSTVWSVTGGGRVASAPSR